MATFGRAIHRLHAAYLSLPFALLLPPMLLGAIYLNDYFGHSAALIGLSILLIIEAKPPFRFLCVIVLPLISASYVFGRDSYLIMLGWLVACGIWLVTV